MPPPCEMIGPGIIVCSPAPRTRRCRAQLPDGRPCRAGAPLLCDGPTPGGETCDLPICRAHALHVGRDRDLCPSCAAKRRPEPKCDPATMPKRLRRPS